MKRRKKVDISFKVETVMLNLNERMIVRESVMRVCLWNAGVFSADDDEWSNNWLAVHFASEIVASARTLANSESNGDKAACRFLDFLVKARITAIDQQLRRIIIDGANTAFEQGASNNWSHRCDKLIRLFTICRWRKTHVNSHSQQVTRTLQLLISFENAVIFKIQHSTPG